MTGVTVALGVLAFLIVWLLTAWRGLVAARNAADATWAAIDVQLRRRHDLLPAVIAAIQAETAGEEATVARLTSARELAQQASTPFERADAERRLVAGIGAVGLLAAERHPALAATAAFVDLQARLATIEDEIQAARRIHNADVRLYLARRGRFPGTLLRSFGEFADRPYFELDHTRERGVPTLALVS
jgi:LemA protein